MRMRDDHRPGVAADPPNPVRRCTANTEDSVSAQSTRVGYGGRMTKETRQQLAALQGEVSRGNLAMLARNQLMTEMFDGGATQPEIVDVVNRAAVAVGDRTITSGAIHRAIKRVKGRAPA